jgi:sucrose phosphorylase
VPQIYYVGLLAGANDLELLRRTGVGRDINRRYYTAAAVNDALQKPVVQSLLALLRLRNTHAAFDGSFRVEATSASAFSLVWEHDRAFARLDVDLATMHAAVSCSPDATTPSGTTRTLTVVDAVAGGAGDLPSPAAQPPFP